MNHTLIKDAMVAVRRTDYNGQLTGYPLLCILSIKERSLFCDIAA
jgi:hypothetical protein